MTWWNLYFTAVVFLHLRGYIHASYFPNLALWLITLPQVPAGWKKARTIRAVRAALCGAAAAALLWQESWLLPPGDLFRFLTDSKVSPTASYVMEFILGAINWGLLAQFALLAAAVVMAGRRRIRMSLPIFLGLGAVFVTSKASPVGLDAGAFYAEEAKRVVRFPKAAKPDFDIVILHVCSISWDDLRVAGLLEHPFLSKFDVVFTKFNSAASYSNPAAIRLLRAPCGQADRDAIFRPADDDCYLLDSLRKIGYRTFAASNHNGRYDDFAKMLTANARADAPLDVADVRVDKLNFDNSPIYDDAAVLTKWLAQRRAQNPSKAAVYYNTVSLHQGAHPPGDWSGKRLEKYRRHAEGLFASLDQFLSVLSVSGRNTVVLFVGEHGAALEGTKIQAPDLREIPLPQITQVPVAIKLIGGASGPQRRVTRPVSYLALAQMLSSFAKYPPFGAAKGGVLDDVLADLPETTFVAESGSARVMARGSAFYHQAGQGSWTELGKDVLPAAAAASR